MKFCSHCGEPVSLKIPPGDNLPRFICDGCGTIHYQNPNLVVGCVPVWQDRILLCKRAIEPRSGYWTIPAGFLENRETLEQAAMRETHEEAMASVKLGSLLAIVNVPHASQVHVMFRAELTDGRFGAGDETLESALYDAAEVPWPLIAFPSVRFALEKFLADRAAGSEEVHITAVERIKY
ncbi:MAG: NUDIX hydrolase [Gammaproteobacteria bacterium]|nr:NUDIX hydrolase [Gammaproteobacteria bacterium]NNM20558.1 NUDIX hydrolase [Gammaproteobacteria bacterium]